MLRGISGHIRWSSAFPWDLESEYLDSGNCYYAIQLLKDEQHPDSSALSDSKSLLHLTWMFSTLLQTGLLGALIHNLLFNWNMKKP